MADPNTPTWLSDDAGGAPAVATQDALQPVPLAADSAVAGASATGAAAGAAASETNAASSIAEADEKDLPHVILMMRLANMGVAVAMIVCAIIRMTTIPSIGVFILAIYATCGALLICCLETQLKFLRVMIAVNFGFLFNSAWRFAFYLLMGSVAWAFETLFGQVVAIAFGCVAVFNSYVLCRYPTYRKMREKIAEEEDKRIEARISKEVKKQVVTSLVN